MIALGKQVSHELLIVSHVHVSYSNLAHTEEAYCTQKLAVNTQILHSTFMQLIRGHFTFSLTSSSA